MAEAGAAGPDARALARLIDHTLLKPEATSAQIERLCDEAREWNTVSVCVNSVWVELAVERLAGSDTLVCTVVGFPLGAALTGAKAREAELALALGAREIDMVLDVGAVKSGDLARAAADVDAVARVTHAAGGTLKVILETALLTDEEKATAAKLAVEAGADYVKTSTGFGPGGATVPDVRLLRRTVGPSVGVKASGGIRSLADARAMLDAGATRLGLSGTVGILSELS